MMDEEKFNNELKNRIAEVFDNFDDTGADEGWALLRQKYPEKEKDRGLLWLWYSAAAIALLCIGLWITQKPAVSTDNLAVKPNKTIAKPGNTVTPPDSEMIKNNAAAINNTPAIAKVDTGEQRSVQQNKTQQRIAKSAVQQGAIKQNTVQPAMPRVSTQGSVPTYAGNKQQKNQLINQLPHTVKMDSGVVSTDNATIAAANKPVAKPTMPDSPATSRINTQVIAQATTPVKTTTEQAMMDLLNNNNPTKPGIAKQKADKKASISLYAATYFNYATGSDNQLNVGAGFTSDFKISNKLKLSTGLAVGQNSLSYNNSGSAGSPQYASAQNAAPATLSGAIGTSSSFNSAGASNQTVQVTKKYKASLIGLDIPINFKYQFSTKSDTYVLAGVSSGTYITETYRSTATTSLVTQESTTRNSFSSFDLAKTLNFSFGVGYPLGKSNRLIVEPFLKYPLDGLGSQQIKFGAGGINLKLNFQSPKK